MSHEFRNVHSARFYLNLYIESGRNLRVIRDIPLNKIDRYDVWMCVFEKEPAAIRELILKEDYDLCFSTDICHDKGLRQIHLETVVTRLLQNIEWKLPITLEDRINVVLDVHGSTCLTDMLSISKERLQMRKDILKKYIEKDLEWINEVQQLIDCLIKINNDYVG